MLNGLLYFLQNEVILWIPLSYYKFGTCYISFDRLNMFYCRVSKSCMNPRSEIFSTFCPYFKISPRSYISIFMMSLWNHIDWRLINFFYCVLCKLHRAITGDTFWASSKNVIVQQTLLKGFQFLICCTLPLKNFLIFLGRFTRL